MMMQDFYKDSTPAEQRQLAKMCGAADVYLRYHVGRFRTPSQQLAERIEYATGVIHRSNKGRTPVVTAETLLAALVLHKMVSRKEWADYKKAFPCKVADSTPAALARAKQKTVKERARQKQYREKTATIPAKRK